ncbi:hypothetical protein QFZ22_001141 [Streptomyces canus]|uniref:Uncharacterized protein n=1 Tax=Streptomyces canus TaxID=58343 RepID=A0AAW8F799_9ACTN|nr:hypothetical protein [Streptomyces canus]MDQ0905156.1 hypothetical protein [Streptomyces canus]
MRVPPGWLIRAREPVCRQAALSDPVAASSSSVHGQSAALSA